MVLVGAASLAAFFFVLWPPATLAFVGLACGGAGLWMARNEHR
jgi:hypothetical protein